MRRSVDKATVRLGLLALLLAGTIYFYLPTIAWLGRLWLGPGPAGGAARDWSHGPLVVLFIGFLLLRRRGEFHITIEVPHSAEFRIKFPGERGWRVSPRVIGLYLREYARNGGRLRLKA